MAFAQQQHNVPRLRTPEHFTNSLGTIRDFEIITPFALAGLPYTHRDLLQDQLTVFVAWIFVGDDHQVTVAARDLALQRPFFVVALPGRAEDADQPALGQRPHHAHHLLERVGVVCIIDHDRKGLAQLDPLHAPVHTANCT